MKKKCQTPGAIYKFKFTDTMIASAVVMPFEVELTEKEAKHLENQLHDALESVLKQFFDKDIDN